VVVFNVEARGINLEKDMLVRLSDYLASRLAESGEFLVVPRDQLKKRLIDQKAKSYKKCYDEKCQIELGREMAADKTLATQVIKLGSRCMVTSTLYDMGFEWVRSSPAGIDFTKSEVTVAQYNICVEAGKCTKPNSKSVNKYCNWGDLG